MAGLVATLAILMIFSLVGYQAWEDMLHREMEAEMVFRAQDIVRGIQRYRRANGGIAPVNWEKLMERGPQGQYFLRKQWTDPLVPDGEWGMLYIGPNGQIVDPNRNPDDLGLGGSGSPFGSDRGGRNRDRRSPLDRNGGDSEPPGSGGRLDSGMNQNRDNPLGGVANSGSFANRSGESGLPIAGVRSLCEKTPFRIYRDLTEYSEWTFTYLDIDQPQGQPGQQGQREAGNPTNTNPNAVAGASPVQRAREGFGGLGGAGSAGNSAQPGGTTAPGFGQPGQGSTDAFGNDTGSTFNQPGTQGTPGENRRRPPRRQGQGLQLRDNPQNNNQQNNNQQNNNP